MHASIALIYNPKSVPEKFLANSMQCHENNCIGGTLIVCIYHHHDSRDLYSPQQEKPQKFLPTKG